VQVIITTIFVLQSCFETIHFEKCYNTVDLTLIICMSHLRHITHTKYTDIMHTFVGMLVKGI